MARKFFDFIFDNKPLDKNLQILEKLDKNAVQVAEQVGLDRLNSTNGYIKNVMDNIDYNKLFSAGISIYRVYQ